MTEVITQGYISGKILTTVTKNRLGYCAYIELPKSARTLDLYIPCTGGVTWNDEFDKDVGYPEGLTNDFGEQLAPRDGYYVVGWDYMHWGQENMTEKDIIEDVLETVKALAI